MTKTNKSLRLKVSAITVALLLLATVLVFPLFFENKSYAETTLQDSLVQNANGEWVSSGGKWNSRWSVYNCYAFALERFEAIQKYSSHDLLQYQPGNFSKTSFIDLSLKTTSDIASLVKDDLVAIGYNESSILISTTIPTVNNNQQLICVRTILTDSVFSWDYHFMRYDLKTNAWYHKPGKTAVLKYKYTPTNDRPWRVESFDGRGVMSSNAAYNSDIYFIRYEKNQLDTATETSTITKNILAGKDTMVKMDCIIARNGHLAISGNGKNIKATIYDGEMNKVATYTGTSIVEDYSFEKGTYYIQLEFVSKNDSGTITATAYNHSGHHCSYCNQYIGSHTYDASYVWKNNKNHLATCICGATALKGHVVRSGSFTGNTATCLLCGGQASIGFVDPGPLSAEILLRTANGSYVLPNGVIVLVDEDIESYFAGTLVFVRKTGDIAA